MPMVDRKRDESGAKPDDAVRKLQRLKKAVSRARLALVGENMRQASGLPTQASELVSELRAWDDSLEEIRCDLAELIAERDRWRIAHDKLRERIDHHSIAPRSEVERKPQKAQVLGASPIPRAASGESQDFSAIDRELERLNASMLREFSSE